MLQSATSFGFGIFVMTLLPWVIDFKQAVIVVLLLAFLLTTRLSFKLREHIKGKILIPVLITSFLGRIGGVNILMYFSEEILKSILGLMLILISLYFMLYKNKLKIKATKIKGITAGFFNGILGGAFNTGGPPLVIYYLNAINEKMSYNSTLQATFAINCIFTIIIHLYYGNINTTILSYTIIGGLGVFAGSYLGLIIFKKIDEQILKKIIYIFLIFMGIMLII
ncbi:MAG: sulfite exporter TauE/SafE family protein [Nanoarchaeota archaeon]